MTQHFFHDPRTIRRLHEGPLGEHIDALAAQLQEQGYARGSAQQQLRVVAELSRWLQRQGRAATDLTPSGVQAYLRYRRQQGLALQGAAPACQKCLRLLRDRGLVAPGRPCPLSTQEREAQAFARYLAQARGLASGTLVNYVPVVRQFLQERFRTGRLRLAALRAGDVTGFVQRHAHDHSPARTKVMLSALRAFLRYLCHCGATAIDLAPCVPSVPTWTYATLPKALRPDQVEQVLAACDRQTGRGRRDYAILLLLARLGLRAGEVAALRLEDIDWASGRLTLRSKGGQWSQLPLPADVGAALAAYLRLDRPRCASRRVFIRQYAPRVGFANWLAISTLVARALARAGIVTPRTGAHVFRHSLATTMLREGASLAEIGELLRHRSPQTTQIYAKVDLGALRALACPWPGGAR
jgi:site-specific recombinase XerD